MATITSSSQPTTRIFYPDFLDTFSSVASTILSTNDKQIFNVAANSANGLSQSYSISAVPSEDTEKARSFTGSLTSVYVGSDYNVLSVYNTDSTAGDELTVRAKNLAPGFVVGGSAFTKNPRMGYDAHVGSLYTLYETNKFAIRNHFFSDSKKHTLESFASFGQFLNGHRNESLSFGANVRASYANSNMTLDSKDAGVTYRAENLHATIETANNMSKVSTTITHRVSPSTILAAQLDAPLSSPISLPGYPRALSLGVTSQFSDFAIRANANLADGTVSTTYSRAFNGLYRSKIPGNIAVTLQSSLNKSNINNSNAIDKVGVRLNFGDY